MMEIKFKNVLQSKVLAIIKLVFILSVLFGHHAFAHATLNDKNKIKKCVLNYIEGWYTADGDRMREAIHPKLSKCRVSSSTGIKPVTAQQLITKTNQGIGATVESERKIDISILDISQNKAAVLLISKDFFDYLNLVKVNNKWKILNVIWDYHDAPNTGSIEGAEETASDFINSRYDADGSLISSVLHRQVAIRAAISTDEVEETNRDWLIDETENGHWSNISEDSLNIEVKALSKHNNYGCAKVIVNGVVEYLLMSHFNKWLVVKVLWNQIGVNTNINNVENFPQIQLNQNRPNPFNQTTQISYNIPSNQNRCQVQVKIYDTTGRLVRILEDSSKTPGEYTVMWDGKNFSNTNVANGIYYYSLSVNQQKQTKQMVLLR